MSANIGILAMEVYFPSTYVKQEELEIANGVSAGKYTIGLGQEAMAFTGDHEDINSVALSVVQSLMEKYNIDPKKVGRLEVGTESLVDKSKSTKTVLMELFANSGNTDIEGATVVNACYGGTAALLNALTWVDSSSWVGRYAIVVAADIAVYSDGPARPTGGCGSVAMLIGRNAPLVIDLSTRVCHATHVWDFFKPNMDSEYPEVNGGLSQSCYLRAIDDCYTRFLAKTQAKYGNEEGYSASGPSGHPSTADYFVCHSPYNKLVQKSFGRLIFQDILANRLSTSFDPAVVQSLQATWQVNSLTSMEKSLEDKELENILKKISSAGYKEKVDLACKISKQIGNTYTASVYMNLAYLAFSQAEKLLDKKAVVFSYGSGALASMFAVKGRETNDPIFNLANISKQVNIDERLNAREKLTPADLQMALQTREDSHGFIPFTPKCSVEKLSPGTYYLANINEKYERSYARKPLSSPQVKGGSFLAAVTKQVNQSGEGDDDEGDVGVDLDQPAALPPPPAVAATLGISKSKTSFSKDLTTTIPSPPGYAAAAPNSPPTSMMGGGSGMKRNVTQVWASGRPNVKVVVTGVSAALPGRDSHVFSPNNIQRIINGEVLITPIPLHVKDEMLEKNMVEVVKSKVDGSMKKIPITSYEQCINVSASLGKFSLASYGVAESIVSTMDRAVQVAIAAGLEALKDAGIVRGYEPGSGNGALASTSGWELPVSMQNTTGIVYATSFPALDTAIEEVSRFFRSKTVDGMQVTQMIDALRQRLIAIQQAGADGLSKETEEALDKLQQLAITATGTSVAKEEAYEFDRKFLFRVLVLGNAQLAQIIKAKGPNMQTNAACAGATQAIALAYDMIQVGRAERVVVIAGDSASSDTLLPWLGAGFRSLGAATTCAEVNLAARPFHPERSGMILGSGGIGLVLESEAGAMRRYQLLLEQHHAHSNGRPSNTAPLLPMRPAAFRCRLLGTLVSNSAYHGAAMDRMHIAQEFERFLDSIEKDLGITRHTIARQGVYFSHETMTHASPASSCAANELYALRAAFGEDLKHLLILNTKGFTGHPMGVSFEDVVAAEVLVTGRVPPIANFSKVDPHLGDDLKISQGGEYPCKYALRFAAGFGSQIALALYGAADV